MIAVYGSVPEFFETQEAAIQKFNSAKPALNTKDILIVITGTIVIGLVCYYTYQYLEDRRKLYQSLTTL